MINNANYLQFHPVYEEELLLITPDIKVSSNDFTQLKNYEKLQVTTYEEEHYVFGKWFETYLKKQPKPLASKKQHFTASKW